MNKIKFSFLLLALGLFPEAWAADPAAVCPEGSPSSALQASPAGTSSSEISLTQGGEERFSSETKAFSSVPQLQVLKGPHIPAGKYHPSFNRKDDRKDRIRGKKLNSGSSKNASIQHLETQYLEAEWLGESNRGALNKAVRTVRRLGCKGNFKNGRMTHAVLRICPVGTHFEQLYVDLGVEGPGDAKKFTKLLKL